MDASGAPGRFVLGRVVPGRLPLGRVARTKTSQAVSTATATPSPVRGISGIAIPTKPPMTHASCRVVSERANAEACTRSRTSRWIVESSDSLASDWARPAVRPSSTSVTTP